VIETTVPLWLLEDLLVAQSGPQSKVLQSMASSLEPEWGLSSWERL
jgi:hypothetical protein